MNSHAHSSAPNSWNGILSLGYGTPSLEPHTAQTLGMVWHPAMCSSGQVAGFGNFQWTLAFGSFLGLLAPAGAQEGYSTWFLSGNSSAVNTCSPARIGYENLCSRERERQTQRQRPKDRD